MGASENTNYRLIVVDDEADVLESYRAILSPVASVSVGVRSSRRLAAATKVEAQVVPFEVTYVSSGEVALEKIEQALTSGVPFVGGFFDVKMKDGIDGIETIRRAKDLDSELLCVVVTAYQDRSVDDIQKIFGDEFSDRWDFLAKPFTAGEIEQKASNLVADWNRRRREKLYLEKIQSQQKQLIESERLAAVGTLAKGIGHEFGNILLGIIGNAELALQGDDATEMREALEIIEKSANRAGVIVRNLQKLVNVDQSRSWISLEDCVRSAVPLMRHEFKKWRIEIEENYASDVPQVEVNEVEIGQIALNLLINAVHALQPDGGKISIRIEPSKSMQGLSGVALFVSDTGTGISPENIEKIFQPLFTTKGGKGSGIGLSVSRKIIENHQGEISAKSTVGKGTEFKIWLPQVRGK